MAFKKLIVNELDQCPDCGGKGGLRYFKKMDVPHFIEWGSTTTMIRASEFLKMNNQPAKTKTARCIDCGKRVEFEVKSDDKQLDCYSCGKPWGNKTPCPHCGYSVPF